MYDLPTFEELRQIALQEYAGLVSGADTSEDSEIYARASLAAAVAAMICYGVKRVEDQIFPDTCDWDTLLRHGAILALAPRDATAAAGTAALRITGTIGTLVPDGLTAIHDDGTEYLTGTGGAILPTGYRDVDLTAVTTGTVGNKFVGDELTVQAPPPGIDSTATLVVDTSGGTDDEDQESFSARVLTRMRQGNAGGTATDYEQWALDVDGVIAADCLALRRGPGTVSVAVFTEGPGGRRTPADAIMRGQVLSAIDDLRPVTADVDVPVVTEETVDVTVTILEYEAGHDEAEVRTGVETAIEDHIYALGAGDTLYRTRLARAISEVAGVLDYTLTAPAANVKPDVTVALVEVLVPGTVTVT